jgi:DsbC/DsbD-like thiol-disulfide interchange protein
MKKIFCLLLVVIVSGAGFGQGPVSWSYEVNKKSAGAYEVVLTAEPGDNWHIYTGNPGLFAAKFSFKPNPLVKKEGAVKETGKPEQHYNPDTRVEEMYFSGKVQLIQLVKLKGKVKTSISGTVEYAVCNDSRCLPKTKTTFDLKII